MAAILVLWQNVLTEVWVDMFSHPGESGSKGTVYKASLQSRRVSWVPYRFFSMLAGSGSPVELTCRANTIDFPNQGTSKGEKSYY